MDSRLADIARELDAVGHAAELFDADWQLLWVSNELKTLLGAGTDAELGVGRHVLEGRNNALWTRVVAGDARLAWSDANLAYILAETPPEALGNLQFPPGLEPEAFTARVAPRPAPPAWSYRIVYNRLGFQPMAISCLGMRINDEHGEPVGTAQFYVPALPANILDLVARGDAEMFGRMARLVEPGRREAGILFADLEASGSLSRRLPSAAYFCLIRDLTTAIDRIVGAHGGVVGKHAGDGVTAFFLVEELGSPSAAARASIEAAREIGSAAAEVAAGSDGVAGEELPMNVGLHWSGAMYMGQVVTGGRLEVTALGDEMNECARIQQTARGGAVLASKVLIERLAAADATELGVDLDGISYRTVAELPGVGEKSIRDAGSVPVAEL